LSRIYDLGPFRLDADLCALTRAGAAVALGARAVAVLTVLVERAHKFVSKSSIIDAAWEGLIVEESNLAVQVHAIRRVLAGAPGGDQWIETFVKRGYRFVGPVSTPADAGCDAHESKRSNLPTPLTSFIGRERELTEIKRLLASKRLVTIVGAGGIGKTRCALQAATAVIDAYRDGVWIAELGSIRDPALVTTTVAHALGVHDRAGTGSIEALSEHVKSRQVLLLLDNCEHLLQVCAELAETLLGRGNNLTVMATRREPLRVAGEHSYPLSPLSLPEPGSNLESLQRSEAVALFVERVQRQLRDFELTPERAPAVTDLCIHLDGIPLALELAAARAQSLSVEQINLRLADRFRLLTAGARTALPRQQTLRATLDWSYGLLTEPERVVLRRLAIFPGGFTVEAASSVASDEYIDEYAVIDVLSQLVSRSLVIADMTTNATRYRLLETTRAYALEKLVEVGETHAINRRHGQFFRETFDRVFDHWLQTSDTEWHSEYAPELGNIRTALDWAFGPDGDAELGVALAGASGPLWSTLGLFNEGVQRLELAGARIDSSISEPNQARLWNWLGRLLDEAPLRARPALERSVELYRRIGDELGLGISLARLGRVLTLMGKFDQAEAALSEARPFLEYAPIPQARNYYFFNSGFLNAFSGDLGAARRNYEKALIIERQAGNEFALLATMGNLANVNWALGDLDAAAASLREQEALLRGSRVRTNRLLGFALMNLSGVLTEKGEVDEALMLAREGLPLVRESGSAWLFIDHVALRAARAGKLDSAGRLAGYADAVHAANGAARQFIEARTRDQLHAVLREALPSHELDRLLAEGAKMSEDEACRLALEG